MTRTSDDIKKGLFVCSDFEGNCPYCPYAVNGHRDLEGMCVKQLVNDADVFIQQLEADNAQLNRCIENMTDKLNALNDEVAKLQAERDAAVNALRLVQENHEKADEVIDNEVFPLVDYDVYRRLRDDVDDMMSWEVESDSRGVQKEE